MSTTMDPQTLPTPRKVAVASAVGATIEWYDFFLYGTAAGLVFDKLYFNGLDGPAAQFAAFATFAVGFLARPIGGLLFGHFGDRIGRKKMLLLTLVIMGAGTAAIGLLPSYDQIGVWAPVLLVVLRVLQGIGVGGEYGGAVLLAVEYAPAQRRGFFGSFAHIGVPGGLLLAAGAFSLAGLLPDAAFLAWGWRACFLISIVLLGIGAYIRLSIMETPAFARVQEAKESSAVPLRDLLKAQPKRLLLGMGTRWIEGFTFNLFSVFLLAYVVTNLGLPKEWALNGILAGAAMGVVLVPITGALSDRVGRKPVFRAGTWAALVLAFPVAALVQSESRLGIFVALVAGLGLVYGVVYGPLAAFWSELFDTRYRYTALSSLYQISGVVASGLTPLIAAWLVSLGNGTLWWVAAYNVAIAVISLISARLLPETRGRDLDHAWRPAPSAEAEPREPLAA
jgi:MFS transporter, MHS family, shikimate and dehydroshikimate transport protein